MTPRPGSNDGGGAAVIGVELGTVLKAGETLWLACRDDGGNSHRAIRAHFGFLSVLVAGGLPPDTATWWFGPRPEDALDRFGGTFSVPVMMAAEQLQRRLKNMSPRERVGVPDGNPDPVPYVATDRLLHVNITKFQKYQVTMPSFKQCVIGYEDRVHIYRDRRAYDLTPEYRPSDLGYKFEPLIISRLTFTGLVHPQEMLI